MFLDNNDKYLCSGCTACQAICPVNAIKMVMDEEGFKYPKIDTEKCIDCGACKKVCPNVKKSSENSILNVYGAKHKKIEERETSRSGAAFIAISDYILENGGIVYGCVLNKDFSVSHARATNKEERDLFKGSKYVQSNIEGIINDIKKDLKDGRTVLFSGTACQVAGVKSAIPNVLQENLYCCDLICHGVPSTKVYEDFLDYMEKTQGKKIKEFIFRDKSFGWSVHYETMIFDDNSKVSTQYFRNLFLRHNILRPACHKCNYANPNRPADITIADFWGIDEISPEFYDEIGVSLVIINSEKGNKIFEIAKKDLNIVDCSIEDCIKHTYTLNQPTPEALERKEFWKDYKEKDFSYIINKYAK